MSSALIYNTHMHKHAQTCTHTHTHAVSPYNPDDEFIKNAPQRLDAVGFSVYTSLANHFREFKNAIGLPDICGENSFEETLALVFDHWLSNRNSLRRPPTWKSLLDILKELGLKELSQRIEEYLSNGKSFFQYVEAYMKFPFQLHN